MVITFTTGILLSIYLLKIHIIGNTLGDGDSAFLFTFYWHKNSHLNPNIYDYRKMYKALIKLLFILHYYFVKYIVIILISQIN